MVFRKGLIPSFLFWQIEPMQMTVRREVAKQERRMLRRSVIGATRDDEIDDDSARQ